MLPKGMLHTAHSTQQVSNDGIVPQKMGTTRVTYGVAARAYLRIMQVRP